MNTPNPYTPEQTYHALLHADYQHEPTIVRERIGQIDWNGMAREQVSEHAQELVQSVRQIKTPSWMQAMLNEYQLSNPEGLALMSLAEAVLRVPDVATRMALLEDKVADKDWAAHKNQSDSTVVNAATRGLILLEQVLDEQRSASVIGTLKNLIRRVGEPVIDKILAQILKQLGGQFVLGQTIENALDNAKLLQEKGYTYSYDMLGEGAKTKDDARRYWESYRDAIIAIGQHCKRENIAENPGISIKLSALHPRYEVAQTETVMSELLPEVLKLAHLAADFNMGLNIDAEEAERLELSMLIIEHIMRDETLREWKGLGIVVQAYNPRAPYVLKHLYALAQTHDRNIMVRLVKGAYWDAEIKRAQVLGLNTFPVFTRKSFTDVSYLACARLLLSMNDRIYAQFATHNAHTVSAILHLINDQKHFIHYEFQRLHGMGEALHEIAKNQNLYRCRIYAPVGHHHDLLSYLVRRLLENGANGSFVHQIANLDIPAADVASDPITRAERILAASDELVENPVRPAAELFRQRQNSRGFDLSQRVVLDQLMAERAQYWQSRPAIQAEGAQRMASHNPANTADIIGHVVRTEPEQVPELMARAQAAQGAWAQRPVQERAEILERIGHLFEANTTELLALLTREAGKSWADAVAELREAVDFCYYYAAQARQLYTQNPLESRGVMVCISPWNFPLAIFAGQIVASLVMGNAVIAKPAELTPLVAERAVQLMHEAGVPQDALILAQGHGAGIGAALTSHPDVAGVCFTGSMPTAQRIHRALADHTAPSSLLIAETGGLNAMIVDSTALPEQAVRDIITSGFQSAGQRCSALRMLYVQKDIADKLLTMLKGAMDCLVIGDPADLTTDVGPVIDEVAQKKLQSYIDQRQANGQVLHQKAVPAEHAARGHFIAPTLVQVNGIADLGEEMFGPIVHFATFDAHDLDQILDDVHAQGYGLTLGLHTRIERRAQELTGRAHVGNIYVNRNQIGAVVGCQPFGGCGLSGTGPKAGGPLYLTALAHLHEDDNATYTDILTARQLPWDGVSLDSPTGERNIYRVRGRGEVLCLGPSLKDVEQQIVLASATHNRAIVPHLMLEEALKDAPELARYTRAAHELSDASIAAFYDFDAVAYFADDARAREIREGLSKMEGPIIPLISSNTRLHDWVHEFHVCTDTTAAGGNAELLASHS